MYYNDTCKIKNTGTRVEVEIISQGLTRVIINIVNYKDGRHVLSGVTRWGSDYVSTGTKPIVVPTSLGKTLYVGIH